MFDSIIAATIKRTIDTRINNKISLIYILDSFHSSPTVLSLLIAALTSFISNFVKINAPLNESINDTNSNIPWGNIETIQKIGSSENETPKRNALYPIDKIANIDRIKPL